ncbi:MAG: hypothetical protein FWH40_08595 [Coriobacteriia bacterium]|nr:hypothetical protein [Coriobacteriia bacterium]
MPTLTPKENYMRMIAGEVPEYVPSSMDGVRGFDGSMGPDQLKAKELPWEGERVDYFGVKWVRELTANNGAIPKPNDFILDDITKWRDVIKRPAIIDEIDWQFCADRDLAAWDPSTIKAVTSTIGGQAYFQQLVAFTGFDYGLVACFEEPEEVKALLNFIVDINIDLRKKAIYYYQPEMGIQADDIAHERAPFISVEMFVDIFEPIWRADIAPYVEAGILTMHHNCGKLDEFVPYLVDMGFNAWNPAEPMNDLVAIKEKFPKLAICGGFDGNSLAYNPNVNEEMIRGLVRETCDTLAPNGGFAFGGFIMGLPGDPTIAEQNRWIFDEFEKIRYSYY